MFDSKYSLQASENKKMTISNDIDFGSIFRSIDSPKNCLHVQSEPVKLN